MSFPHRGVVEGVKVGCENINIQIISTAKALIDEGLEREIKQ